MQKTCHEGIFLLNKDKGKTSFQIIFELKKILKIKKIGHSGTLDKNASGLLIIGPGRATRLLKYLIGQPKKYLAEIYFGIQTATDDAEGNFVKTYNGEIKLEKIKNVIPQFIGQIKQVPPDFSAVHVNGKRAYKIAIKNEKPLLKEREIEIKKIKFISFNSPILKLEIECSSGTYIRSIARDMGIKTGYYGYLFSLKRESIGNFMIENAVTLNDVESGNFEIISAYESLKDFDSLEIKKDFVDYIKNGRKIDKIWFENIANAIDIHNGCFRVHFQKELLAVIEYKNSEFQYDLVY